MLFSFFSTTALLEETEKRNVVLLLLQDDMYKEALLLARLLLLATALGLFDIHLVCAALVFSSLPRSVTDSCRRLLRG